VDVVGEGGFEEAKGKKENRKPCGTCRELAQYKREIGNEKLNFE
jgi:hypothetical protein